MSPNQHATARTDAPTSYFAGRSTAGPIRQQGRHRVRASPRGGNTSSRVRCASAARAKIALSDSIHPELWIYHLPSSEMTNTCLANMPHDHGYEQGRSIAAEVSGDHEAERRVVALVGCGRHDEGSSVAAFQLSPCHRKRNL